MSLVRGTKSGNLVLVYVFLFLQACFSLESQIRRGKIPHFIPHVSNPNSVLSENCVVVGAYLLATNKVFFFHLMFPHPLMCGHLLLKDRKGGRISPIPSRPSERECWEITYVLYPGQSKFVPRETRTCGENPAIYCGCQGTVLLTHSSHKPHSHTSGGLLGVGC